MLMRKLLFESLLQSPLTEAAPRPTSRALAELARSLRARSARRRLGRSLSIREVDAGSCNGCELEIHALGNAFYDLERFGLRFVASPRHADVLLVTGPVTKNMREALERTYEATPDPKWVVAVGDCAINCGVFADSYACAGPVSAVIPVDLEIQRLSAGADQHSQGLGGTVGSRKQWELNPGIMPMRSHNIWSTRLGRTDWYSLSAVNAGSGRTPGYSRNLRPVKSSAVRARWASRAQAAPAQRRPHQASQQIVPVKWSEAEKIAGKRPKQRQAQHRRDGHQNPSERRDWAGVAP